MPSNPVTKHPSIRLIAKYAKVAPCTVSRVLNAKPGEVPIRQATRDRVLATCARFNYHPNVHALRLFSKRCQVVAAMIPCEEHMPQGDSEGLAVHKVLAGISRSAGIHSYDVLLIPVTDAFLDSHRYLELYRGRHVDGMLIYGLQNNHDYVRELHAEGCPMVLMHSHYPHDDIAQITTDSYGRSKELAKRLIELGHRRIAYITAMATSNVANRRCDGFLEMCQQAAVSPRVEMGDFSFQSGYEIGLALLRLPQRPSAIATANDSMALGVLQAARELNLRVPDELSVMGADGTHPYYVPTLSTINVPYKIMGQAGFDLLLRLLDKPQDWPEIRESGQHLIASTLVDGETVSVPSSDLVNN